MSKFCPIVGKKVVYLVCQECTDRVCERPQVTILPKKEKCAEVVGENKVEAPGASESLMEHSNNCSGCHPACDTCCHKTGEQIERFANLTKRATYCEVYRNYLIDIEKVAREGCEYHNRDMSDEKICMNCEHYLGGGDWGLACAADYYKLPNPLTEACAKFKRKIDNA